MCHKKKWALLTYIAVDNNLSEDGKQDLIEMCLAGASDDLYIGGQIDTMGSIESPSRFQINPKENNSYKFESNNVTIHHLKNESISEYNCSDPAPLINFLKWGWGKFNSENKILVLGGHGNGFKGFAPDYTNPMSKAGNCLNVSSIQSRVINEGSDIIFDGLEFGLKESILKDNKIQILGFDSCLMSMLEIAHHFKDTVDILISSQAKEPGSGWPYTQIINQLKRSETPELIAVGIVNEYIRNYHTSAVTLSAIKTDLTAEAINNLDEFGLLLVNELEENDTLITEINILRYNEEIQTFRDEYIDILHFAGLITESEYFSNPVKGSAFVILQKVKKCILHNGSVSEWYKDANGLSVWFPKNKNSLNEYLDRYKKLKLNHDLLKKEGRLHGWTQFINKLNEN
jgi:hypothetical protein